MLCSQICDRKENLDETNPFISRSEQTFYDPSSDTSQENTYENTPTLDQPLLCIDTQRYPSYSDSEFDWSQDLFDSD